jgi:transcriptional regulator with XRE-family HTH domain
MPNVHFMTKEAKGVRKPTLPDDVWEKVEPLLLEAIGVGKPFKVKQIADALDISSPSVSPWINGKGRPTLHHLIKTLQIIGHDPVELLPEYLKASDEPWRVLAIQHGEDPTDPTVQEVYSSAFQGALGLTSEWAKGELTRRRSSKEPLGVRELDDDDSGS